MSEKNILPNEVYDNLIKTHIEKMWGGLEMASVQHFMETGKVNGNFRLRLLSLMQFHLWKVQEQSGSEPEGKTHEDAMRDDFGVPKHVKLDGDEPEGKEAVELGLSEVMTLAHKHFEKTYPMNGLQSLAERYPLEDMVVRAFVAAFDDFKIWKAEAK